VPGATSSHLLSAGKQAGLPLNIEIRREQHLCPSVQALLWPRPFWSPAGIAIKLGVAFRFESELQEGSA